MPEIIRTRLDVFKDLHNLFMHQAPSWDSRDKWQRLVAELDEVWNREMAEQNPPMETNNE